MKDCSSYYSDTCCSVYSNEFMNSSGCTYYPTRQQRRRARKNHGQQGRSMVEMLGVLAIVGVLSIGGIAGYRYAMNKYSANEIMNGVSKRAVIAMAQLVQGKEVNQISLSEFEDEEINGAQFSDSAVESPYAGEFGIAVTGVKESVCQNLIDMADDRITITESTDLQNPITEDECSDSNSLAFLFDSDTMMNSATMGVYYSCQSTDAAVSETGSYYRCSDYTEYPYCVGSGGYYVTGSEAAKALCGSTYYGSTYYYCQSGRVWNDLGGEYQCDSGYFCTSFGGYYANGSLAVSDLCGSNNYSTAYFYCTDSYRVRRDTGSYLSCEYYGYPIDYCEFGSGYYSTESEAAMALCGAYYGSAYYYCQSGRVWNDLGGEYQCDSGYFCTNSGGYYADGSLAVRDLCGSTYYGSAYFYCQSGRVWNDYGEELECWNENVCVGSGGYYANGSEAMWDLCGSAYYGSAYFYCTDSHRVRRETGSYLSCEYYGYPTDYCEAGSGYYSTESEAAIALCGAYYGSAYYYCQSGRIWNDYGAEFECWDDDVCVGSGGYYADGSLAVNELCGSNIV